MHYQTRKLLRQITFAFAFGFSVVASAIIASALLDPMVEVSP